MAQIAIPKGGVVSVRKSQSGKALVIRVAETVYGSSRDGEQETIYYSLIIPYPKREGSEKYAAYLDNLLGLPKGTYISALGRILRQPDVWEYNGQTYTSIPVFVDQFLIGSSPRSSRTDEQSGADSFTEEDAMPGAAEVPF